MQFVMLRCTTSLLLRDPCFFGVYLFLPVAIRITRSFFCPSHQGNTTAYARSLPILFFNGMAWRNPRPFTDVSSRCCCCIPAQTKDIGNPPDTPWRTPNAFLTQKPNHLSFLVSSLPCPASFIHRPVVRNFLARVSDRIHVRPVPLILSMPLSRHHGRPWLPPVLAQHLPMEAPLIFSPRLFSPLALSGGLRAAALS